MIANQAYGILGLVAMSYQLVFELLGPILLLLLEIVPLFRRLLLQSWSLFAVYVAVQLLFTFYAAYIDAGKDVWQLKKQIPKLMVATLAGIILQILLVVARL